MFGVPMLVWPRVWIGLTVCCLGLLSPGVVAWEAVGSPLILGANLIPVAILEGLLFRKTLRAFFFALVAAAGLLVIGYANLMGQADGQGGIVLFLMPLYAAIAAAIGAASGFLVDWYYHKRG